MKHIHLIILLTLAFLSEAEAKKVKGRIIFKNDTLEVTFNLKSTIWGKIDYEKVQYQVKYYDTNGKKIKLLPDDALEIQFYDADQEFRMLSRYNSLNDGRIFSKSKSIFLALEKDGELKLFRYYYSQASPGMYNGATGTFQATNFYTVDKYILQKGNGELKRPKDLNFKKDMASYFSDCPELAEKILSKSFVKNDLEFIVAYYNSNCN
jgi:hypothetical protein